MPTARGRDPGRSSRWRRSRQTGSPCRRWAGASSVRCSWTTSPTAWSAQPREPRAAGQIYILTDGVGVSCREFFGHYYRMLGRRGPPCLPTPVAVALARANRLAARLRGEATELNPASTLYLTRRGTYSIDKARDELGYEPAIHLNEGMRRTEVWLRREGII